MILPPEPVSLSIASILKILLLEGVFCDQKELAESHRNRKPEIKNEHAGRQKKRVMEEKCKSTEGTKEQKGKREEVKAGKQK